MKNKLEALVKRIDDLNTELSNSNVTSDMERYKKISKEHSEITPVVEIYKKYQKRRYYQKRYNRFIFFNKC